MCSHLQKKKRKIGLKTKEMNWLIGKKSRLSIQNKLLIYKAVIKLIEPLNGTVGLRHQA
jgi:hypothetical protein